MFCMCSEGLLEPEILMNGGGPPVTAGTAVTPQHMMQNGQVAAHDLHMHQEPVAAGSHNEEASITTPEASVDTRQPPPSKKSSEHFEKVQQVLKKSKEARLAREATTQQHVMQHTFETSTAALGAEEPKQEARKDENEEAAKKDRAPNNEKVEDERKDDEAPKEDGPKEKEGTKKDKTSKQDTHAAAAMKLPKFPKKTIEFSNFKEMYKELVPALPSDFGSVPFVTADQQEPPKKRGRKPKNKGSAPAEAEEPAPKRARRCKSKANLKDSKDKNTTGKGMAEVQLSKEDPTPAPTESEKPKAKRTRASKAKQSQSAASDAAISSALEELPIPRENRKRAKLLSEKTLPKPKAYEAMELGDEDNAFDAAAAASAASAVEKLSEKDEIAGDEKEKQREETKARLSRKSCAYKKARNLALKEGKTKEEASAAGKRVTSLILRTFWCIFRHKER